MNTGGSCPVQIAAGMTIAQALAAATPHLPPLETRILLGHVLGLSRVQLITRDENVLDAAQAAQVEHMLQRRLAGEPVAYLTGQREFFGLVLEVGHGVLIPRPETELLVELAMDRLINGGAVLDLGTGSGAIAIALASQRRDATIAALDISETALAVARRNATRTGVDIAFTQSDWYAAIGGRQFDMLVSNPPYIVAGDHHLSSGDLRYEPVDALTDHGDGLSAYRILTAGAPAHLRRGGWLLMEHGHDQAGAVRGLLGEAGFQQVESWNDLAGIARVSGGRLP